MPTTTSATKTIAPVASDEYIMIPASGAMATDVVAPKTLSRQPSSSSDERSWDFASVKNSKEQISGSRPVTTDSVTAEKSETKDNGIETISDTPKQARGLANPPPRRGLRSVPAYTNLRAKIPRETKLVAGLPVIWAKTGDPKHDLQLFDRVYLGKEDPNKTSF
ncbi:hypothetical protein TWF281_002759 [Arthrobotrys megalospora]